mmetsp:Transcript_11624/g.26627  ORF Transcript_11624/g.26627 Transcript_11624/m.26627 type:complete len:380 (-) Transcript_11624:439-1578(-)
MPDINAMIDRKQRKPPINRKKDDVKLRLRAIKLSDPDSVMKTLEDSFIRAAQLLLSADYVLIAAGAGFSADSGLPVYKDIADVDAYKKMNVTYADLCIPDWLLKDPEIFYGFWGSCYNDYLGTCPHRGYEIVKEWVHTGFKAGNGFSGPSGDWATNRKTHGYDDIMKPIKQSSRLLPNTARPTSALVPASRDTYSFTNRPKSTSMIRKKLDMHQLKEPEFFVYTSNVDTAFQRAGINSELIYEIHGDVMKWQCRIPCCQKVWTLPDEYRFEVDEGTRRARRARRIEGEDSEADRSGHDHERIAEIHEPSNRKGELRGLTPYTQGQSLDRLVRQGDGSSNRHRFDQELRCQVCDGLARPNVLMFDDDRWASHAAGWYCRR